MTKENQNELFQEMIAIDFSESPSFEDMRRRAEIAAFLAKLSREEG